MGKVYLATKTGERVTMSLRPELAPDQPARYEASIAEWEAAELAAEAFRARKREAARVQGLVGEIDAALRPLIEATKRLSSQERFAFGELLARRFVRGGK